MTDAVRRVLNSLARSLKTGKGYRRGPGYARSLLITAICLMGYTFEFLIEWPFRLVMGLDRLLNGRRRKG